MTQAMTILYFFKKIVLSSCNQINSQHNNFLHHLHFAVRELVPLHLHLTQNKSVQEELCVFLYHLIRIVTNTQYLYFKTTRNDSLRKPLLACKWFCFGSVVGPNFK